MDWLDREGVRLAYEDVGKGPPPIVLVHDLGGDHFTFAEQIERLRSSHRVIAVDLRGHGESERSEQVFTVQTFVDDLVWLLYELGVHRPILIGLGLGALIALKLVHQIPELPLAIVAPKYREGSDGGCGQGQGVVLCEPRLPRHIDDSYHHRTQADEDLAVLCGLRNGSCGQG